MPDLFSFYDRGAVKQQTQELFRRDWLGYAHCRIPGLCVTPGGAVLTYCEARRVTSLTLTRGMSAEPAADTPRDIIVARKPKMHVSCRCSTGYR